MLKKNSVSAFAVGAFVASMAFTTQTLASSAHPAEVIGVASNLERSVLNLADAPLIVASGKSKGQPRKYDLQNGGCSRKCGARRT